MSDYLIEPEKPVSRPAVSIWAKNPEFMAGKEITPVSCKRLTGDQTSAKPEFRDKDGATWRMVFIDHDNGDMKRQYENCYKEFRVDIGEAKVVINKRYQVRVGKTPDGKWKWEWVLQNQTTTGSPNPAH